MPTKKKKTNWLEVLKLEPSASVGYYKVTVKYKSKEQTHKFSRVYLHQVKGKLFIHKSHIEDIIEDAKRDKVIAEYLKRNKGGSSGKKKKAKKNK